ncbi:MAG: hypothetical protein AB2807_07740, partial [Candidatus Sedimenticola endophacoides]
FKLNTNRNPHNIVPNQENDSYFTLFAAGYTGCICDAVAGREHFGSARVFSKFIGVCLLVTFPSL